MMNPYALKLINRLCFILAFLSGLALAMILWYRDSFVASLGSAITDPALKHPFLYTVFSWPLIVASLLGLFCLVYSQYKVKVYPRKIKINLIAFLVYFSCTLGWFALLQLSMVAVAHMNLGT